MQDCHHNWPDNPQVANAFLFGSFTFVFRQITNCNILFRIPISNIKPSGGFSFIVGHVAHGGAAGKRLGFVAGVADHEDALAARGDGEEGRSVFGLNSELVCFEQLFPLYLLNSIAKVADFHRIADHAFVEISALLYCPFYLLTAVSAAALDCTTAVSSNYHFNFATLAS